MHAHTRKYLSRCNSATTRAGVRERGGVGARECGETAAIVNKSATRAETRVARVRAEYPNQLDDSGSDRCHTSSRLHSWA